MTEAVQKGRKGKEERRPSFLQGPGFRWGVYLLAGLGWAYALFGNEGIVRQWNRMQQRDQLKAELEAELRVNQQLRAEVEALAKDDLVIEQAIRDQLDFQRPYEQVLILPESHPTP